MKFSKGYCVFYKIAFITLLILVYSSTTLFSQKQKTKQPNIILFYIDDLGWMDLSCQGSEFYETPAIDKLASEGIRFTNGYTPHPRCLPARYGVLTGRFPARDGVPGGGQLTPNTATIGKALQNGGYKTFFAGKWHLVGKAGEANLPDNQGFDINIGGGKAGAPKTYFYPYRKGEATPAGKKGLKKNEIHGLENGKKGEYLTDRLTNESVKFMKKHVTNNADQPFFVYLSHYGVHTPFEAKKELIEKYKKKLKTMNYTQPEYEKTISGDTKMRQDLPVYAAMIESIDHSMAKISETLNELGVTDNTIIIFTADNGGLSTRGNKRKLATSNYPLRYGKGWLYEGGIREAFIVKWPGVSKPGTISDAVVCGTDIYPTALSMAGLKLQPKNHIDGVDISRAIKGKKFKREQPIFWHSPMGRPNSTGDNNSSAVRLGDYKLIEWYDDNSLELFNIKKDIKEEHNLADKMPEKAKELHELLSNWKKEINAPTIDKARNKWYR